MHERNPRHAAAKAALILKWTARVWSIASILFIAPFFFGEESGTPTLTESIALAMFPGGVVMGMLIAWWRAGLGGAVSVLSLIAFYVYMFALQGHLPGGPYFILLAVPGFLFLASRALSRR